MIAARLCLRTRTRTRTQDLFYAMFHRLGSMPMKTIRRQRAALRPAAEATVAANEVRPHTAARLPCMSSCVWPLRSLQARRIEREQGRARAAAVLPRMDKQHPLNGSVL